MRHKQHFQSEMRDTKLFLTHEMRVCRKHEEKLHKKWQKRENLKLFLLFLLFSESKKSDYDHKSGNYIFPSSSFRSIGSFLRQSIAESEKFLR